jgi:hypothetical protein
MLTSRVGEAFFVYISSTITFPLVTSDAMAENLHKSLGLEKLLVFQNLFFIDFSLT